MGAVIHRAPMIACIDWVFLKGNARSSIEVRYPQL